MNLFWLVKLVGISLFIFIVLTIDRTELLNILSKADIGLLAVTALMSVTMLNTFKALRWHCILRWIGIDYTYLQTYITYQASIFIGMLTPGRMGEMFRSVYLKTDHGTPISTGIASTGTDRMFDMFGLLTLAGVSLAVNPGYGEGRWASLYFFGSVIILFILLLLFLRVSEVRLRRLRLFKSGFMGALLADFNHQVGSLTPGRFLIQAFNTIMPIIIFPIQCSLLAKAVGFDIDPLTAGGIAAVASLVAVIPITVYGLGTREASVIALMSMLGYSETEAFTFSLLIFFNFWIVGALWGLIFWLIKPLKTKRARAVKEAEEAEFRTEPAD